MEKLLSPFISLFTSIANTLLLIFGINPQNNDSVTEDEVKDLIEKVRKMVLLKKLNKILLTVFSI